MHVMGRLSTRTNRLLTINNRLTCGCCSACPSTHPTTIDLLASTWTTHNPAPSSTHLPMTVNGVGDATYTNGTAVNQQVSVAWMSHIQMPSTVQTWSLIQFSWSVQIASGYWSYESTLPSSSGKLRLIYGASQTTPLWSTWLFQGGHRWYAEIRRNNTTQTKYILVNGTTPVYPMTTGNTEGMSAVPVNATQTAVTFRANETIADRTGYFAATLCDVPIVIAMWFPVIAGETVTCKLGSFTATIT